MASAQGYVRYAGAPVGRCFYTAYFKSNNGGSPGPGAGQRASQWMSGVYITEDNGIYSVALSSDNFLGAAATVSNGDQLVVVLWRLNSDVPTQAGGTFFSGQSRTDGSGGTHARGFRAGNGAALNYAACDRVRTVTFTMTGNAWNATPGGIGGQANGDVDLLLNGAPAASIAGVSIDQLNPTAIQRGVAYSFINTSADDVTNKLFTFNSQTVLEAMSAAHNPGDGTSTEGSRFDFSVGLTYGASFGTPVGGDANGPAFSSYAGPLFKSHSHTFPSIDLYRVVLTIRDDSEPSITDGKSYYVKTSYRAPTLSLTARRWCSWAQFLADPTVGNANWNAANPNTINDVARVDASVTDNDASVGLRTAYRRYTAPVAISGGVQTINQPGIGAGIAAPCFLLCATEAGAPARKVYRVTASTNDSITIAASMVAAALSTRDWYALSAEPAGGTLLTWDWEVDEGAGFSRVGRPRATFPAAFTGTALNIPGIGNNVTPGWNLSVIDGPGRATVRIASVIDDDHIVLASPITVDAGDSFEVGCRDALSCFWPQTFKGTLNFRINPVYSTGWAHTSVMAAVTQTGTVGNIPPQAVVSRDSEAGASTTYTFDGRRSFGTQIVWVQDSAFMLPHALDGLATFDVTDPAINATGLRDGHAWLTVLDSFGVITAVHRIVDLDKEHGLVNVLTIATNGSVASWPAGTKFRTSNAYEVDGGYQDNDVSGYAWNLRTADPSATAPALPASHAEFVAAFPRDDGNGTSEVWTYTYSEVDNTRWACIELTVTDASGATNTTWQLFQVTVTSTPPSAAGRPRRVEWD